MRIKFYVATTVLLILFLPSAYAYDDQRCLKGLYSGRAQIFGPEIYISTTQFMSSWGPCSAIGERETERLNFVVVNRTSLEKDAARGMGENLDTLASLYGISAEQRAAFRKFIQQNYVVIFGLAGNKGTEEIFNDLEVRTAAFKASRI